MIRQSQDSANERYYLYDGLGSTRKLTDASGATTDSYDYGAFGSVLNQTGATQNYYLFTGEQFDLNLRQQYLRARYYDPGIGRFTQQDTWIGKSQDPATLHKYLYAASNPISFKDPSGYFFIGDFASANTIQSGMMASATPALGAFVARSVVATTVATTGLYMAANHTSKTMIRKCLEDSRSGGKKCQPNINIFVVADSHNEVRDHVADAQNAGAPSVVTRRARAHNRSWIGRLKRAGKVCQGGGQCDEYPMAIHEEGGNKPSTSLRSVDGGQNMSIGGMVGQFHSKCEVGVGERYKFVAVQGVPMSGYICSGRN